LFLKNLKFEILLGKYPKMSDSNPEKTATFKECCLFPQQHCRGETASAAKTANPHFPDCRGCIEEQPNQMAHVGPGGCLEDAYKLLENYE
jgi:hypothetical protein